MVNPMMNQISYLGAPPFSKQSNSSGKALFCGTNSHLFVLNSFLHFASVGDPKKEERGTPWGSEFSLNMMIKHQVNSIFCSKITVLSLLWSQNSVNSSIFDNF
jgi:hypothetical protein